MEEIQDYINSLTTTQQAKDVGIMFIDDNTSNDEFRLMLQELKKRTSN